MNYWIYENWVVVKDGRVTIHTGDCSYCNYGRGMNKNKDPDVHGRWHGPFDDYEKAKNRASGLRSEVRDCSKCIVLYADS